jgi:serine-type D-Ala-D-Ala endopeptidase (penicillin-binding protein 7)
VVLAVTFVPAFFMAAGTAAWAAAAAAPRAGAPRAGAHRAAVRPKAARPAPSREAGPAVRSNLALVIDADGKTPLYSKHPDKVAPIASITKLMTAMVVLDEGSPLSEEIAITRDDIDTIKYSGSRLPVRSRLKREDLLLVALMASDNRAASALARAYPGGTAACVDAMNRKAVELGMHATRFADPTGLSDRNVSTAADLARLVLAARAYPRIRAASVTPSRMVNIGRGRVLPFHNSNRLVNNRTWSIGLSKTGYIDEAGRCLVMEAKIAARDVVIVLLDSFGKYTRLGDASRIRTWMEQTLPTPVIAREPSSAGAATSKLTP